MMQNVNKSLGAMADSLVAVKQSLIISVFIQETQTKNSTQKDESTVPKMTRVIRRKKKTTLTRKPGSFWH